MPGALRTVQPSERPHGLDHYEPTSGTLTTPQPSCRRQAAFRNVFPKTLSQARPVGSQRSLKQRICVSSDRRNRRPSAAACTVVGWTKCPWRQRRRLNLSTNAAGLANEVISMLRLLQSRLWRHVVAALGRLATWDARSTGSPQHRRQHLLLCKPATAQCSPKLLDMRASVGRRLREGLLDAKDDRCLQ